MTQGASAGDPHAPTWTDAHDARPLCLPPRSRAHALLDVKVRDLRQWRDAF